MNCLHCRTLPIFLLVLLFSSFPVSLFAEWQFQELSEPYYNYLAGSADEQTLVATHSSAGAYLSRDGGQEWTPINTRLTTDYLDVRSVSMLDADADTIFLAGAIRNQYQNAGRIWMTVDGGETWSDPVTQWGITLDDQSSYFNFEIDPMVPSNWFVFDRWHLAVSQDSGATWRETSFELNGTYLEYVATDPGNPDRIYALTDELNSLSLYRSEDAGGNWNRIILDEELELEIDYFQRFFVFNDGTLFLQAYEYSGAETQLFHSTDFGTTWQTDDLGGLEVQDYWNLVYTPVNGGKLFAFGGLNLPVLISSDQGDSWQEISTGFTAPHGEIYEITVAQNGDLYGTGRFYGGFRIPAPHATIEDVGSPVIGGAIYGERSFAFCEEGTLLLGDGGRIYHADGASWELSPLAPVLDGSIYYETREIVWYTPDVMLFHTTKYIPAGLDMAAIPYLQVSSDDGQHWDYRPIVDEGTYEDLMQVRAYETDSGLKMICYSMESNLSWVSADTGRTWQQEQRFPDDIYKWDLVNGQMIAIPFNESGRGPIIYSGDFGNSWSEVENPDNDYSMFIGPIQASPQGWMFPMLNGYYLLSYDGELEKLSEIYTLDTISDQVLIPELTGQSRILVGHYNSRQFHESYVPWSDWNELDLGNPFGTQGSRVAEMAYDPYRNRLWIDNGAGLACKALESGIDGTGGTSLPLYHDLLTSYPNPFNSSTTITFTLVQPGLVHLALYDLLGREVALLHDGVLQRGMNRVNLQGDNLTSGVYFLTLQSSSGVTHRKVTLLK